MIGYTNAFFATRIAVIPRHRIVTAIIITILAVLDAKYPITENNKNSIQDVNRGLFLKILIAIPSFGIFFRLQMNDICRFFWQK